MTLKSRLADPKQMVPYSIAYDYGYVGYAVASDQDLVSFMLNPQAHDYYLSVGFYPTADEANQSVQDWIDGKWR